MIGSTATIDRFYDTLAVTSKSQYVYIYDINKDFARWSANAVDFFGLSGVYIEGAYEEWKKHIHPDDLEPHDRVIKEAFKGGPLPPTYEYRARNANGEYTICSCKGAVIKDYTGRPSFYACFITNKGTVGSDDPITHLPTQFQLLNTMAQYRKENKRFILMMVNFMDFGTLNRQFGYMFGNSVLATFASQFQEEINGRGEVFRGTGTSFAVVTNVMTLENCRRSYARLQTFCKDKINIDDRNASIDIAGGIVVCDDLTVDEHAVFSGAVYAMKNSAAEHGGELVVLHDDDGDKHRAEIKLLNAVRESILHGYDGFYLNYQPIISAADSSIVGMEVLIRWNKEPYGEVSPARFIPLIEQDGVFYNLGNWVLSRALKETLPIVKNRKGFFVNVNLGFMQLDKSDFRMALLEIIRSCDYPGTSLCLEISGTNGGMSRDHLKSQVNFIKSCGVKIAVDVENFAALDMAKNLPVDIIKLGSNLAMNIGRDRVGLYMMESAILFASRMNIKSCVSGIEDEATAERIRNIKADYLQGYYYSKPVSIQDFSKIK